MDTLTSRLCIERDVDLTPEETEFVSQQEQIIPLPQSIQIDYEAQPISYSKGTGGPISDCKAAGA
jgi:hypothetical protein